MFFILLGTCGAAANILFAAAYLRAARQSSSGPHEIGRFCLFVAGYEISVFLLLSNMVLSGMATLAAVGVIQFLAYKANYRWTQAALQSLKTHLPNSEGPKAVGSCLVFMTLISIFLLLGTPLSDEALWVKLLFAALMPISTFCGVSLLALGVQRT